MSLSISTKNTKNGGGLLYSDMKVFYFEDKINSLPKAADGIKAPIHIRIKPTNVCNHNCFYCAYRVDNLQLGKDMVIRDSIPREKMLEIIDDLKEMDVKAVTFSGGGEPFCYPFLMDTVKRLAASEIKFASLTNGSLLMGKIAEFFANNAQWIRVSIDGWDDESYSYYRGTRKGEFDKVMRNLKNFKKFKGTCYLGACIVVDKKNAGHIFKLVEKLENAGVDSVKVSPCIVSNDGRENNEYHKKIFGQVKQEIARAVKEFSGKKFEIFDSYHTQLETFEKDYTWCPYLQILPVIGADLNVYPCHDKAYNLKEGLIGSIKSMRFKDFWFSDKNNFFKINPVIHCNHHCVAHARNKLILEYLNVDKEHLEFV